MIICILKKNGLWDACPSCCSFPCSGGCPCVCQHTGLEPPRWGRVEKVHTAHLPCHALPLPPAVHLTQHLMACFCIPSCSGFSRCTGELSQSVAALWMGWIPPSIAALSPSYLVHGVSAGSHPTASPGHAQHAVSLSLGAAWPLISSGMALHPSHDCCSPLVPLAPAALR